MRRTVLFLSLALALLAGAGVRPVAAGPPECRSTQTNVQGSSGADITVDATSTGVLVMAASTSRCQALIRNSGSAQMRCGPVSKTLTASAYGMVLDAGQSLVLGQESAEAWKCIRTGSSSTTANVTEALP